MEDNLGDYSRLRVRECWLVSPEARSVEVLELSEGNWRRISIYGLGDQVRSNVLPGLALTVEEIFGWPFRRFQMATHHIADEFEAEQRFKGKLVELGLLKNITIPSGEPEGRRTPIKVKGKPISQTIIEDRRWVAVYYLDTSALVKRYIQEAGTTWLIDITDPVANHDLYIVRITGPEMIAAFFRKVRMQEMTNADASRATANFKTDFANQYQIVEITSDLADRAMNLAQQYGLRGYDAVQLAAASELHTVRNSMGLPPLTFISADNNLNTAARADGMMTEDPNGHQ